MLDGVEIRRDFGKLAVGAAQFLHQMGDRKPGGLAVERLYGVALLALPLRDLAHDRLEPLDPFLGAARGPAAERRRHVCTAETVPAWIATMPPASRR